MTIKFENSANFIVRNFVVIWEVPTHFFVFPGLLSVFFFACVLSKSCARILRAQSGEASFCCWEVFLALLVTKASKAHPPKTPFQISIRITSRASFCWISFMPREGNFSKITFKDAQGSCSCIIVNPR